MLFFHLGITRSTYNPPILQVSMRAIILSCLFSFCINASVTAQSPCFDSLNEIPVKCLLEADGQLFVGTSAGLFIYSLPLYQETVLDIDNSILDTNSIRDLAYGMEGVLISTEKGIFSYLDGELYLVSDSLHGELAVDGSGRLLIAGDYRFYILEDGQVTYSFRYYDLPEVVLSCSESVSCDRSTDIGLDEEGNVWIAHYGFYEYDVLEWDGMEWTVHDRWSTQSILPIESPLEFNSIHPFETGVLVSNYGGIQRHSQEEWSPFHHPVEHPFTDSTGDSIQGYASALTLFGDSIWLATYPNTWSDTAGELVHWDGLEFDFISMEDYGFRTVHHISPSEVDPDKLYLGTDSGLLVLDIACALTGLDGGEPNDRLSIHPNPNTGEFMSSFLDRPDIERMEVMDLSGRLVYAQRLTPGLVQVRLPIPDGTYLIGFIMNDGRRVFERSIIQR